MLNTAICKSDRRRRRAAERRCAAGQVQQAAVRTAPRPQLSVCHAMEMHPFNYDFKTLIRVCVLQVSPLCLLRRG